MTHTMSKSQSNSKENLELKKVKQEVSPRRSSMPSVIISPTELLLNQSLQNKLAQNESNRHGFILTDTDASVLSGGSSEFLLSDRSDTEILLTAADLNLKMDNRSSTISSSDLFSTDIDTDKDDYDEVADCSRREMTPVRQDIEDVIRQDLATQITSASALNDLSDPNRSPALNITMDEYGASEDVTTPQNALPLIPIQQISSHPDWKTNNDKIYNSPDDNFQEPKPSDKDLYYDSSDLNLEASSSSEDLDKEINTIDTPDTPITVEQKNNTVDQNMSTSFQEKALSSEQKDVEIKLSETPDTIASCHSDQNLLDPEVIQTDDVLSPLISETVDPLGILSYPGVGHYPEGELQEKGTDSSEVILPRAFPEEPIYFTRNQRSIRPSKRRSLLIRSSSLDKKYMTQKSEELHSDSMESFEGDDMYVVEAITPCSPISITDREFLNPTTPGMTISYYNHSRYSNVDPLLFALTRLLRQYR